MPILHYSLRPLAIGLPKKDRNMLILTNAIALLRNSRLAQLAGIVVFLALAAIGFRLWLGGERKEAAKDAVATERREQLEQTIERTERADNAAEEIRRNPDARNDECLRHARNPNDC